jgi:hypothetical protein
VAAEPAVEREVHAGDRRVEARGRIGTVVEGVEPLAGGDRGPAPLEVAAAAAEVQVRHRVRAEPKMVATGFP